MQEMNSPASPATATIVGPATNGCKQSSDVQDGRQGLDLRFSRIAQQFFLPFPEGMRHPPQRLLNEICHLPIIFSVRFPRVFAAYPSERPAVAGSTVLKAGDVIRLVDPPIVGQLGPDRDGFRKV